MRKALSSICFNSNKQTKLVILSQTIQTKWSYILQGLAEPFLPEPLPIVIAQLECPHSVQQGSLPCFRWFRLQAQWIVDLFRWLNAECCPEGGHDGHESCHVVWRWWGRWIGCFAIVNITFTTKCWYFIDGPGQCKCSKECVLSETLTNKLKIDHINWSKLSTTNAKQPLQTILFMTRYNVLFDKNVRLCILKWMVGW